MLEQLIQTALVCMWAIRLGLFLFMRVMKAGQDSRFNRVRDNPKRFFVYWTIQGNLTILALLGLLYKYDTSVKMLTLHCTGIVLCVCG